MYANVYKVGMAINHWPSCLPMYLSSAASLTTWGQGQFCIMTVSSVHDLTVSRVSTTGSGENAFFCFEHIHRLIEEIISDLLGV